jgi:hypothetical protein
LILTHGVGIGGPLVTRGLGLGFVSGVVPPTIDVTKWGKLRQARKRKDEREVMELLSVVMSIIENDIRHN